MADSLWKSALVVGQQLHPALAILNAMHAVYQKIELNKARLADLLKRCQRVIGAIDQHMNSSPSMESGSAIKQLLRHLRFIESLIGILAQLGFMKTLLRRDEISGQITECHQRLNDCLMVFQINASRDLRDYMASFQEARDADEAFMKQQFAILNANDAVLMQKLDLLQNQVEAMATLYQNLHQNLDKSIERQILQAVLMALQRSTGKTIDAKSPSWTITSFDIDIDHNETIGRGGFAVVKKGKWGKLLVAVKEMTNVTDTEPLLKEIKVWKRLRHNHVLQFYGASLMASPPFLVSRYMKNGNIIKYLAAINPAANRVQLAHEIALGMLYIHEKNIVHGDLKGVNVLIDDSGQACITDFGLSKIKQHATSTHAVGQIPTPGDGSAHIAGTLRYMSPEAMTGTCNKACDVYSYAMALYEIFTDEPPFLHVRDFMLYFLIVKEQKRLDKPTDAGIIGRGLTPAMWALIWNTSDPVPSLRYSFTSICNVTEGLVEEWDEGLATDRTTWEAARSVQAVQDVAHLSMEGGGSRLANSIPDQWQQAQLGLRTPYVWSASAQYPDPGAQAWAQYYAKGGTDPAGRVYFTPESLPPGRLIPPPQGERGVERGYGSSAAPPRQTSSVSTDVTAVDFVPSSRDSTSVTNDGTNSRSQPIEERIAPAKPPVTKPPRRLPKIPTLAGSPVSGVTSVFPPPSNDPLQLRNASPKSLLKTATPGYPSVPHVANVSLPRSHAQFDSTGSAPLIEFDSEPIRQENRAPSGYSQYERHPSYTNPLAARPESPAGNSYGSNSASSSQLVEYSPRSLNRALTYSPDIPSNSDFQPSALVMEQSNSRMVSVPSLSSLRSPSLSLPSYDKPSHPVIAPANDQISKAPLEPSAALPSSRESSGKERSKVQTFAELGIQAPKQRRKLVVVGDGCTGKTLLMIMYSTGIFPEVYAPTDFEKYSTNVEIDGEHVELALWDTSGNDVYDQLRPLSYPDSHVILITFAIDNPVSLVNVQEKWISEVMHYCPGIPIVLVGCKKDLRRDRLTIENMQKASQRPVTPKEGLTVAQKIGAGCYLECSAKTGEGVREVFQYATRCALRVKKMDGSDDKECLIV
ncbi:GTP-binding protein Rho1 [Tulasnella sp. 331]|nr:GTP-binding protein Rho1 [Tulasnella sp. 331]KAG8875978.1 GTP-binding protein Rho1 [Tulasnella sp. 332]